MTITAEPTFAVLKLSNYVKKRKYHKKNWLQECKLRV